MGELWLLRHGETAWSLSGQHTGRTDIPLTPRGRQQAELLARRLLKKTFALVLTSPLARARETCQLAGQGASAVIDPDLMEWDYGAYEGRTSAEIRKDVPGWTIWSGGVRGGETADQVGVRTDRVIARGTAVDGDVAVLPMATCCGSSPPAGSGSPRGRWAIPGPGHCFAEQARSRARAACDPGLERELRLAGGPVKGRHSFPLPPPSRRPRCG
jgi:probable phosphoglycerate mutase